MNDLDVAVYVKAAVAPGRDADLVPWLADRLADANPTMKRDQFEENEHCVTVNFEAADSTLMSYRSCTKVGQKTAGT